MKQRFLLVAAILPAFALAQQTNFSISGKIGKLNPPAKVYIDYSSMEGGGGTDSADVVNGTFTIKGKVTGYGYARMGLDHEGKGKQHTVYMGDTHYFYFGEGENLKITSKDSLLNASYKGSKVYDAYMAYNKFIGGSIMELTKAVNAAFNAGTEAQKKDSNFLKMVDQRFRQNLSNRNEKQILFAEQNPGSYFSVVALSEAAGAKMDVARIEPIFNAIKEKWRNTDAGKELVQRMASVSLTAVGSEAPAFTQANVEGKPVALKDFKGKYVLVEFWASWCGPCRAENPNLVKQYAQYKEKGFEILSVSLDSEKDKWVDAIQKDGLPWTHVSDLKGWNNAVGRLYGVRGVPASFLVGPDGKIVGKDLRGESLNKKLEEVMGE
ncbi:TlpA disulfide reductase family protein [Parasegetibacter sp. NRK P23]|uniref:TlpA disulfide reductase family protein n=1 Tax=Parasegetibacter sp. NRK P23 TaxID=2942999 RepID=UPI0020444881|nr:TlpA disulfide reductase family protein [Parasegetibacter sp. NRK P23]MCM5527116.1 AhpC/TSA family protein [Parasegetibacter sp. NRK P23]